MNRFTVAAAMWILLAATTTPLLVEVMDERGYGLAIPGLPVTVSEILLGAVIALGPIAVITAWRSKRRRNSLG